jgi:hypothetical protein
MRTIDLSEYYPSVVKDTNEFKALANAENPEFNLIGEYIEKAYNELFVLTSEDWGLDRMESLLGITKKETDTVEDRRTRILAKLNGDTPYTMRSLDSKLKTVCGEGNYSLTYSNDAYTLSVDLNLISKNMYEYVKDMLYDVVPAAIALNVRLVYNTYGDMERLTHGDMEAYTHTDLYEEVLNYG